MQRSFEDPRSTDCSICLEHFRRPRLLPCGHTFCTRCLQRLVAGFFRPNYIALNPRFCCPLCRKVIEVPVGGVKHFPSDVLMVEETFARKRAMQRASRGNNGPASEMNSNAHRGGFQTKFKIKIPPLRSCGIAAAAAAILFVAIIVILVWCSGLLEEEDKPKFLKSTSAICQHLDHLLSDPEEEVKEDWFSQLTDFCRKITDKIYGERKDEKIKTWWDMMKEYLQTYYEEFCTEVEEDQQ